MRRILLLLTGTYVVSCLPPPHPAVVAVQREEELLPSFMRSPLLHNHRLMEILSLTSLLHEGEKLVYEREADNVPRRDIYNILTHAGLISRNQFHQRPHQHHQHSSPIYPQHHVTEQQQFNEHSILSNPELLQHL
ncbi:uncharacterized protein ACR2FA_000712 [Aphomia sociella]